MTKEDRAAFSMEGRSSKFIHAFLDILTSGLNPIPRFSGIMILAVDRYVAVHLLHSLLSVSSGVYSTVYNLFSGLG